MKRVLLLTLAMLTPAFCNGNIVSQYLSKLYKPKTTQLPQPRQASALYMPISSINSVEQCINMQKKLHLGWLCHDAIILRISSTGGSTSWFFDIYKTVKKISEKIPVVIFIDDAISAGYLVASAGNYIVCNPMGGVGSIGTVCSVPKYENPIIQSGEHKVCGGKLKDCQQNMLQNWVDELYSFFCQIVAKERNLNLSEKNKWADGKQFSAENALELGLIDKIGTFDDAVEKTKKLLAQCGVNLERGLRLVENLGEANLEIIVPK